MQNLGGMCPQCPLAPTAMMQAYTVAPTKNILNHEPTLSFIQWFCCLSSTQGLHIPHPGSRFPLDSEKFFEQREKFFEQREKFF